MRDCDLKCGYMPFVLDYNFDDKKYVQLKNEHPISDFKYSYTSFISWYDKKVTPEASVDTDRIWEMLPSKHDRLCRKNFGDIGQWWQDRKPKDIENFLREWYKEPKLKLAFVKQNCKKSNGNPYWTLAFKY